jgi:MFS transporter, ACS family, glucarate transporter
MRIRHRVVFLSFLTAVLLYLDRFVLTYTERIIKLDLGLTDRQMDLGLSAFFWSYALAQIPSGLLTDRYGPRRMLTLYVLLWSLGTALMGLMNGFVMLVAVRLAIGLAQAGAYPTCAAIVGRWAPLKERGTASGLVAIGGRIGGGIAPLLTALLVMQFSTKAQTRLEPADVLLPEQVAMQMRLATAGPPPEEWSWERQEACRILQRVAAQASRELRIRLDRLPASEGDRDKLFGKAPPKDQPRFSPEERRAWQDQLASALNEAISGPFLTDAASVHRLPVEREVIVRMGEGGKTPADGAEVSRCNRLLLEGTLPGSLRPLYRRGWRPVMWVYGAAGIVVAALFWLVVRDDPASHPRISTQEIEEIQEGRVAQRATDRPRLPLGNMLKSRGLWVISGSQFFANIAWTFLVLQLPRYLQEAHQLSFADRSFYASIPLWCGWGGMFLGGPATDYCVRRFGLRLGRVIPLAGSRLLGTVGYLGLLLEPSLPMAMVLLSLVAIAADFASPATWAFNQDIGGRFIGSTLGWGNMWGNIGSALSPLVLSGALDMTKTWTGPFAVCAAGFALGGVCTLLLDPRESIDQPEGLVQ